MLAEKLILNVKCDGYAMDVSIICENNNGQTYTLSNSKVNDIDFGQVYDIDIVSILIINKFMNIYYIIKYC